MIRKNPVPADIMTECLKNKNSDAIYDMLADCYWDDQDESCDIDDMLCESEYNARLLQHSNYDCWVPPYDCGGLESYDGTLKETIDMLGLNPADVKKELSAWCNCTGSWPNRPNRKPVVDVKEFSRCGEDCPNYGLWGFLGLIKGSYLQDKNFTIPDTAVIPKGTICGWYNTWNGGGTCHEIETIRDVSIKELKKNLRSKSEYTRLSFELDEKDADNGYSITQQVYGYTPENNLFIS